MSFIDRESYSSSFSSGMNADDFISARKINIVVADSYPMIVQGLRHIFSSVERMQIVAEAHTLSGMASLLSSCECDVLICDYAFGDDPEPDGMRMLETIRRNHPNVKIILLAELRDGLSVQRVMKKGVSAFVVKSSDDSLSLPKIVDKVMRGADPASLPVEHPTKFELAFNLRTASAPGRTIPQSVLLSADKVIQ